MTRFIAASLLLLCVLISGVLTYRGLHKTAAGIQGPSAATVVASSGTVPAFPPVRSTRGRRNHHHPARTVTLDTTAYCETGTRTASGVYPKPGMAASNLFPFGQRLRVPGIGVVVVTDRIGWGSQLDIYMGGPGCEQRALTFGRRSLEVAVLR